MTTLEDLPPIEGGTAKQKIFAESVRLNYIQFIETRLDPKYYDDATFVLKVRVHFKWWIDRVKEIDEKHIKTMISSAKAAVTRAGSIEAAIEAQRISIQKQIDKYREYLEAREAYFMDTEILADNDYRERPF